MKRLSSQQWSFPGPSKRGKKDTAIVVAKTLLNLTAAASDAFGPLKSVAAGLQFIVDRFEKVGANRYLMEKLLRRIQKIQESTGTSNGSANEADKRRREDLAQELEEISRTVIEPLKQRGRIQGIFKAPDDGDRIQEYIIKVEQCLFDYQMSLVEGIYALNVNSGEREVLNNLTRAKDAAYNASDDRPHCLENTRVDIQKTLQEWAQDSNAQQIYWLNGIAGSGKTTIAQSLAEYLAAERKLGASFFCSRESTRRSDLKMILPTIAFQLSHAKNLDSPKYRKALVRALETNPDLASLSLQNQIEKLLIAPARKSPIEAIILIDALDECKDPNSISIILRLIANSVAHIPTIKFFITSRPEPHIRSGFRLPSLKPITETMILHEVGAISVEQDIRLFLRSSLGEIAKNRSDDALSQVWPTEENITQLTEKSAGLFIFASTAVKFINSTADSPRDCLSRILDRSETRDTVESFAGQFNRVNPYENLDLLYLDVIRTACSGTNPQQVYAILVLLVIARDPLSTVMIAEFFGIDPSSVKSSLRALHSILLIPNALAGYILFHHKSLPDFLTDPTRCTDPKYVVNQGNADLLFAQRCVGFMNSHLKKNICDLPRYAMNDELDPAIRDQQISETLRYCCRHWANHLLSDKKRDEHLLVLSPLLEDFLSSRQLMWFEALSLIEELHCTVEALSGLREWLASLNVHRSSLLAPVTDGYQFIMAFFDIIELSAWHIYHSALVFAPDQSLLKQNHSESLEKEAKVVLGTPSTWNGPLRTVKLSTSLVDIEYSHDGRMIAGSDGSQGLIWISTTGERRAVLESETCCHGVSFSCDDKNIAVGTEQSIILFDVESGARLTTIPTPCHSSKESIGLTQVSFHPHHPHILLSIEGDGGIIVWEQQRKPPMLINVNY